ncbi:hypothetical protein CL622_05145 [archaeon]|nr:hypothetical protein [archaeon]|tara:strand:- start:266 stop:1369 length:1104 start_codon:yes stop_codon:yes gene_type:complete
MVSNASKKEATIHIYGVIGGFDFKKWEPINQADQFVEDFNKIEADADVIHVKINSPGGNIHDGLPIYNTLKNSTKEIKTYIDGIAYSMASLIALAGDTVYAYKNSMLMFHNGLTYSYGNAKEMRKQADVLDVYDESLGSIIEEKLGITEAEVKEKYLNYNDNFFTGKSAKKEGFVDEIITTSKAKVPENISTMSPTDLMEHYSKMNFKEFTPATNQSNSQKKNTMSKKTYAKLEKIAGATLENATEEGVFLNGPVAETVEGHVTDLEDQLATATTERQTALDEKATAESNLQTLTDENTQLVANVNTTLGLEGDAAVATVADAVSALEAKIAELGKQPGETHTKAKKKAEAESEFSYIDFSAPMYNP